MPWILAYFLLITLFTGMVVVWGSRKLAYRWNVLDVPDGERKRHSRPVPLLGGLAIFATIAFVTGAHIIAAFIFEETHFAQSVIPQNFINYYHNLIESPEIYLRLIAIFSGGIMVFFVGLFDDLRGASVKWRLLSEFLIAALVVAFGLKPELSFLPDILVWFVTIFWIVTITNAFNFIDGLDGLCGGVGAISAGILCYVAVTGNQPLVAILLCVFFGALLAFLRENFFPAKIFLGSAGSMFIGYVLAVIVLVMTFMRPTSNNIFPIVMPVIIFGVPLFDIISVVIIRIKEGRSPLEGDRNHIAHRLLRIGFTQKQAVMFIYLLAFAVGVDALYLPQTELFESIVVLVHTLALFGIIIVLERVRAPRQKAKGEL